MISNQNQSFVTQNSQGFNLKKTLSLYSKQWKWFLLCVMIGLGIAYTYLRYTTPIYVASAQIMLLDDTESSSGAVFKDLSLFTEREDAKVEDEIQVLQSRNFLENIIKNLKLNVQYFSHGKVYASEIYKNAAFSVNFIASDSIIHNTNFSFHIDITSSVGFDYKVNETDEPKKFSFGENIPTSFGGMIITPNTNNLEKFIRNDFIVYISSVNSKVNELKNNLYIGLYGKSSKILDISYIDPIPVKAKDIISNLIEEYNTSTIKLKNARSKNTADFIDSRVELIASDLVNVDDSIVRFKTGNKITDVSSEAGQFLSSSVQNEQLLDESKTQLRILDYMKESLGDNNNSFQAIPSNLGLGDGSINALSANYSQLLANRERIMQSAGEKNLVVVELDRSLNTIRQNLNQSIDNATRSLNIRINSLENQSSRINSKIFSVPGQESRLRSIERKQGIKESLYLYLLQKREEATISLTATSPNLKVVEKAYSNGVPISPNQRMIYLAALFIGLFIPFSVIYVKDLLDSKIHNKEDLDKELNDITVLGELPRVKGKELNNLVSRNDRSLLSESFRMIRTNFEFVRRGRHVQDYDNVIFVTSTINGEGKSFFSINMALTLANTDKRVLLIGADIRNPQTYLGLANQKKKEISKTGLTEYLTDDSKRVDEVIETYTISDNKIDVLLSGKVPPNPAELLMNERMKPLFDTVSKAYDYVIVDTAPSMLVTDTLLFSQYAGHTVYVTRADYTEKSLLNFAKDLHDKNKLNGMMLVVNDVEQSNFGYGAKYGYYGVPKKKSFFKRFSKS